MPMPWSFTRRAAVTLAAALAVAAPAAAQGTARAAAKAPPETLPVPAGTYSTTITAADAAKLQTGAAADSVVGSWAVALDSTGHYRVTRNGTLITEGTAHYLPGNRIHYAKDTGPDGCSTEATYHYVTKGDSVTYHKLTDTCKGRITVLTSHPMLRSR
jgi:hypothetical protein